MADGGEEPTSKHGIRGESRYRFPGEDDLAPVYDSAEDFTLIINYVGHLDLEAKEYIIGAVCWTDWHCVNSFSMLSLYDEATRLSYDSATVKIYFREPVYAGGFIEIDNDEMAIKFQESKYRNEKGFPAVYLFKPSEPDSRLSAEWTLVRYLMMLGLLLNFAR